MNKFIKLTIGTGTVGMAIAVSTIAYFVVNPLPEVVTSPEQAYKPEALERHLFAWHYLNGSQTSNLLIPVIMTEGRDGTEHLKPELLDVPVLKSVKQERFQSIVSESACMEGGCSMTTSLGKNNICQVTAQTINQGTDSMDENFVFLHELEHCRLDLMMVNDPDINALFTVDDHEVMETNLKESYADLTALLRFEDEGLIKATMRTRQYWLDSFGDIKHYTKWTLKEALADYQATGQWPSNPVTYSLNKVRDYRNHIEDNDLISAFEPTGKRGGDAENH